MPSHPTYKDSAGLTRSRKAQGSAGTDADPDVTSVVVDGGTLNVTGFGTQAIDIGLGNIGSGTLRVTMATDSSNNEIRELIEMNRAILVELRSIATMLAAIENVGTDAERQRTEMSDQP